MGWTNICSDVRSFVCSDGWMEIPPLYFRTSSPSGLLPEREEREERGERAKREEREKGGEVERKKREIKECKI